jgi:hypothetical protein
MEGVVNATRKSDTEMNARIELIEASGVRVTWFLPTSHSAAAVLAAVDWLHWASGGGGCQTPPAPFRLNRTQSSQKTERYLVWPTIHMQHLMCRPYDHQLVSQVS